MRSWWLPLAVLLWSGCKQHALERHTRTALDILTVERSVHDDVRAACPEAAVCPEVYAAQHALVDTYTTFVDTLDRERDAGHWRRPSADIGPTCAALDAYVDAAFAHGIHVNLPRSVAVACRIEAGSE